MLLHELKNEVISVIHLRQEIAGMQQERIYLLL